MVLRGTRTEPENFDMTNPAFFKLDGASRSAAEASLEFGRFRVVPRRRLLQADGAPIELGTRAFELLLALLEADECSSPKRSFWLASGRTSSRAGEH